MRILIFVALKVAELFGFVAFCGLVWLVGQAVSPTDTIPGQVFSGVCMLVFGISVSTLVWGLVRHVIPAFIRVNWRLAGRIIARLRRKP